MCSKKELIEKQARFWVLMAQRHVWSAATTSDLIAL